MAFGFLAPTAFELLRFYGLRLSVLVATVQTAALASALSSLTEAHAVASHASAVRAVALDVLPGLILRDRLVEEIVDLAATCFTH